MYRLYTIYDTVRVSPEFFSLPLHDAVTRILREKYERKIDPDLGIIVVIANVRDIKEGRVILGDGASYHDVVFDAVAYLPEINEVFRGDVTNIVEFGAFVRMGPFEGLVHLSQITNDFLSYDKKSGTLATKKSNRVIRKGDHVIAKIVTVSLKKVVPETKIGLTMRPLGMGKIEWIREDIEGPKKDEKEKKEKGKEKESKAGTDEPKKEKKK